MSKNFKSVKTSLIMGILLISIFAAVAPTTSAGLIGLSGIIDVNWSLQNATPLIKPSVGRQDVDLDISYSVTAGAFVANFVYKLLLGRPVTIQLTIVDKPDWIDVSLSQGTVTMSLPNQIGVKVKNRISATITVTEVSPAFQQGIIQIRAVSNKVGPIDGYSNDFYLKIQPDYLALINPQPTEGNSKTIGPMDTAVFPFEVENLGNAATKVFFDITYIPEGWIASVTDSVIINSEKGSKAIAYLTVYPPKGFGYHDDKAVIKIKLTPAYAQDISIQGSPESITFTIESRGISVIGIEVILPIIILIIVVIILLYMFYKRNLRK